MDDFPMYLSTSPSNRYYLVDILYNKQKRIYIYDKIKNKYIMKDMFTYDQLFNSRWIKGYDEKDYLQVKSVQFCFFTKTQYVDCDNNKILKKNDYIQVN
jgi:hypothetical protein